MYNQEKKYELIKFEDGDFSLDVNVSPNEETVWLNVHDLAQLFERDEKRYENILIIHLKRNVLIQQSQNLRQFKMKEIEKLQGKLNISI